MERKPSQAPVLVTGPASKLFDLNVAEDAALVEQHIRVPEAPDDAAALQAYLDAAEGYFDGYSGVLGRALVTQTWRYDLDGFPPRERIELPMAPVSAVTVQYLGEDGVLTTFDAARYHLTARASTAVIELDEDATWLDTDERPDAVQITMTCGYGDPADVPQPIRLAALMLAAGWYRDRETTQIGASVSPHHFAVSALIGPYRRMGG